MISIIIPAIKGIKKETKEAIEEQSFTDYEIIEIVGVSPNGRARNQGVKKAKGDVYIFIDDDSVLGHKHTLKNLLKYVGKNNVGIVGASRLLPKKVNWFSRMVAKQIPMVEIPVTKDLTDATPPLVKELNIKKIFSKKEGQKDWSPISTSCLAVTEKVFKKIGGFDENLWWGVDTEFLYRGAQKKIVMKLAPNTWIYHPYANNFRMLWKKYFKSGLGTAHEMKRNPERKLKPYLKNLFVASWFMLYRSVISFILLFVRPFRALSSLFSAYGYIYGWYVSKDKIFATEDNEVIFSKDTLLYYSLVTFSLLIIGSLFLGICYSTFLLIRS